MNVPKKLRCCAWISPEPPQVGQVLGVEPALAPEPPHVAHRLNFLILMVFSTPVAMSSSERGRVTRRSFPRWPPAAVCHALSAAEDIPENGSAENVAEDVVEILGVMEILPGESAALSGERPLEAILAIPAVGLPFLESLRTS